MVDKPEYLAFINPVAGLPAAKQIELLAPFEPTETYVVDKDGDYDQFLKLVRSPRVVLVVSAGLLAENRGNKLARVDSMSALKVAIHKRGSYVVETSKRDSRTKWPAMKKGGEEVCRRLAQGAKSAFAGRKGTPPIADRLTDNNIRDLLRIKADAKRYPNWKTRVAAMKRLKIEPVGRLWMIYQLENVARQRGIII